MTPPAQEETWQAIAFGYEPKTSTSHTSRPKRSGCQRTSRCQSTSAQNSPAADAVEAQWRSAPRKKQI